MPNSALRPIATCAPYLSEPELRRRIRRGLPKVEQLHALARDVFYGRRAGLTPSPYYQHP